jgi:micrococcal nuclease
MHTDMSRALIVLALVVCTFASSADAQRGAADPERRDLVGKQFDARVVRVADGDTLEAVPVGESRPIRMRLQGVDAPELGEAFSREAMAHLRTLVFDKHVRVDGRDLDRYGRLVARVQFAGQDASVALVRAGLACHSYAPDPALAREESIARAAGAGFWLSTATKPQCVERTAFSAKSLRDGGRPVPPPAITPRSKGPGLAAPATAQRPNTDGAREPRLQFRGNTNSRLYHASTCPNFNCRNCTQLFATEEQARAAGFRPSPDCLKQ